MTAAFTNLAKETVKKGLEKSSKFVWRQWLKLMVISLNKFNLLYLKIFSCNFVEFDKFSVCMSVCICICLVYKHHATGRNSHILDNGWLAKFSLLPVWWLCALHATWVMDSWRTSFRYFRLKTRSVIIELRDFYVTFLTCSLSIY